MLPQCCQQLLQFAILAGLLLHSLLACCQSSFPAMLRYNQGVPNMVTVKSCTLRWCIQGRSSHAAIDGLGTMCWENAELMSWMSIKQLHCIGFRVSPTFCALHLAAAATVRCRQQSWEPHCLPCQAHLRLVRPDSSHWLQWHPLQPFSMDPGPPWCSSRAFYVASAPLRQMQPIINSNHDR